MPDLTALRQQLESQKQVLGDKLTRLEKDMSRAHSQDWPEQAQERENDEVLSAIAAETQKELADITLALTRMDKNCYGVCAMCGKSIDPERLIARPEATYCVKCA